MKTAGNVFYGVAFHCYAGDVPQQDTFHNAFPNKVQFYHCYGFQSLLTGPQEIYFTECSGTYDTNWWSDMKVRNFDLIAETLLIER
jgi:O-glycosyl hydrolase